MNGCKLMTTCICFSSTPSPRLWLGWAPRCLKEEPSGGVFVPLTPRSGGALLQRCPDSPALPAALHRPQPSNVRDKARPLGPLAWTPRPTLRWRKVSESLAGKRGKAYWRGLVLARNWTVFLLPFSTVLFWACLSAMSCQKCVCVGGSLLPLRNPHPNFQPVQQVRETPSEK